MTWRWILFPSFSRTSCSTTSVFFLKSFPSYCYASLKCKKFDFVLRAGLLNFELKLVNLFIFYLKNKIRHYSVDIHMFLSLVFSSKEKAIIATVKVCSTFSSPFDTQYENLLDWEYPSLSRLGVQAKFIIGGGPHIRTCRY